MNDEKIVGGRESKDVEQERVHLLLLNRAQENIAIEDAPLKIRIESLSVLLAAFTVRGEA